MKKTVQQAVVNYSKGYVCSQSVLCAFADKTGLDIETAYRISEGFGGGCGGLQEVCGALTAAFAVISFNFSDGGLSGGSSKHKTYAKIREAAELFEKEFGSVICREILHGGKPQPFKCAKKVRVAAEIAEKIISEK